MTELKKTRLMWTDAAYAEVLREHRSGARQCDIARRLSKSPERVRQIIAKAIRIENAGVSTDPLDTLSKRTRNCLETLGLSTVDNVRSAMSEGILDRVKNLGAGSKNELQGWLDLQSKGSII